MCSNGSIRAILSLQFWVPSEDCTWTWWRSDADFTYKEYQCRWKAILFYLCISHVLLNFWYKVCFSAHCQNKKNNIYHSRVWSDLVTETEYLISTPKFVCPKSKHSIIAPSVNCLIFIVVLFSLVIITFLCFSEIRVEGLETLDYLDNLQDRARFTEQGDAIVFESEVRYQGIWIFVPFFHLSLHPTF